jgi:hypothetical protein
MKRKRNADETQMTPNNNVNNINNDNNVEVEDGNLYNVEKLFNYYLKNERLCNAVISNSKNNLKDKAHLEKRLKEFTDNLIQQSRNSETWLEFTKYFLNWNKKTITFEDETINDEKCEYKENDFITNWHALRSNYKMAKIKLEKLEPKDKDLFNKSLFKYSKEDINNALKGLFKQENKTFTSNYIEPTHFLNNVSKYLNAEISKDYSLYGKSQTNNKTGAL